MFLVFNAVPNCRIQRDVWMTFALQLDVTQKWLDDPIERSDDQVEILDDNMEHRDDISFN